MRSEPTPYDDSDADLDLIAEIAAELIMGGLACSVKEAIEQARILHREQQRQREKRTVQ